MALEFSVANVYGLVLVLKCVLHVVEAYLTYIAIFFMSK